MTQAALLLPVQPTIKVLGSYFSQFYATDHQHPQRIPKASQSSDLTLCFVKETGTFVKIDSIFLYINVMEGIRKRKTRLYFSVNQRHEMSRKRRSHLQEYTTQTPVTEMK